MKRKWLPLIFVVLPLMAVVTGLMCVTDLTGSQNPSGLVWAASPEQAPTIIAIDPLSAPNDLDTPIVITGTGFVAVPTVTLGSTVLEDVGWVGSATLTATLPWGMDPGVYTMTVTNPVGGSAALMDAFTVTQGIGVWNAGKLYGGEIKDIAINPNNPATLYAASEHVGLFRSRDGGENWSFVYAPRARRVAIDPITSTTLYWSDGGSLYRSDDEADTWIPLGVPGTNAYPHPTIPGTVYASNHREESGGLWKSEDDGQHWETATNGLTDTVVTNLVFHPVDPMTMVVGTAHGNIFVSRDGGDSWTFASKPVRMVGTLAISPFDPYEVWVSDCCFCVPQHTYKSTNLDYTEWVPVLASPLTSIAFPPELGWGDAYSRTVYAAGCWKDAFKTTDGGDTWEDWGPTTGLWGWSIALDPTTPGIIYKASFRDSVYKTTDGGGTWRVVNEGLTAMLPWQLATDPHQPDVVYAVVDGWGGVFEGMRGGETWQFLECEGGVGWMLVDPHTPRRLFLSGRHEVFRSDDGGQTWPISGPLDPPDICWQVSAFGPWVLQADPVHGDTLLAGIDGICNDFDLFLGDIQRTTDGGLTWTTTLTAGQFISTVHDLAYDTLTKTIVYAATAGSGMLRSTDGGQIWRSMAEGNAALDSVRSIAVEPVAPYRVFAQAAPPYLGLYVSEDHGIEWTEVTPWLWSEQILCTDEDPSVLYAARTGGLLRSRNSGHSCSRAAGVLGHIPVYSLAATKAEGRVILYAGTTGGYVEGGASGALSQANAEGTLVNAGVYRYTTLRRWWVHLPLVLCEQ